jgi:hypothetical protein
MTLTWAGLAFKWLTRNLGTRMRTCNVCKVLQSLDSYHNCKSFPLGKTYTCKACAKEKSVSWNKENKNRKSFASKEHYQENKDAYIKRATETAWHKNNKEKSRLAAKRRREADPGKHQSAVAQRRASRNKATPSWANLEQIGRIYTLCAKVSEKTGVVHHVDHAVPLRGKSVCGLHVENNLQIIPAKMNLEKSNKFSSWEDFGY